MVQRSGESIQVIHGYSQPDFFHTWHLRQVADYIHITFINIHQKWMDQARCNLTMAWTITWESQQLDIWPVWFGVDWRAKVTQKHWSTVPFLFAAHASEGWLFNHLNR
jgi:hypothetical protein